MVELPEAWKAIVNALLKAAVAWQTPAEIAEALGRDVEETTDLLCLMDEAGWITVWEADPGPLVLLSALAAERLHVHLVEVGPNQTPRWARAGDPLPPLPKARNVSRKEQAAALDLVPTSHPSPDVEAERTEQVEIRSSRLARGPSPRGSGEPFPFPTFLRGQGLTPWPGPVRSGKAPCPACGNLPLRPHEYCLYCDRWGLDTLLPPWIRKQYLPNGPEARARQEQSQAEHQRHWRKTRRKTKQVARIEAERARKQQQAERRVEKTPAAEPPQDDGPKPASDKARS